MPIHFKLELIRRSPPACDEDEDEDEWYPRRYPQVRSFAPYAIPGTWLGARDQIAPPEAPRSRRAALDAIHAFAWFHNTHYRRVSASGDAEFKDK